MQTLSIFDFQTLCSRLFMSSFCSDDRRQMGEREEGGRESTADEESDRNAETGEYVLERQQATVGTL